MSQHPSNLSQRTLIFSTKTYDTLRPLKVTIYNKHLISQLLRSSSSVGANYHEAQECESRNDFIHKLSIVKKELNETLYWLELIQVVEPGITNQIQLLKSEAQELLKIFSASISTSKRNAPHH